MVALRSALRIIRRNWRNLFLRWILKVSLYNMVLIWIVVYSLALVLLLLAKKELMVNVKRFIYLTR